MKNVFSFFSFFSSLSFLSCLTKGIQKIRSGWAKSMVFILVWTAPIFALADDMIIPISSDDQISSSQDPLQTTLHIIGTKLLPLLMYGGAIFLLYYALSTIWHGLNEAREKKESDPLKRAVTHSVVAILFGGMVIYILAQIQGKIT